MQKSTPKEREWGRERERGRVGGRRKKEERKLAWNVAKLCALCLMNDKGMTQSAGELQCDVEPREK